MTLAWTCNRCGAPVEARYAAADPFDTTPFNTRLYRAGTEERHVCPKPRKDTARTLRDSGDVNPPSIAATVMFQTMASQMVSQEVQRKMNQVVTEMREDRARVEWEMRQ